MDSKLQPVLLYGFSKSRLYEPLGTAIFFRNRFCPVSWILVFLPVHFYGYSLKSGRTGAVINGKAKNFRAFYARKALRTLRLTQCPQNWLTMMEAPPRLELGVADLQSAALPLGYGAICSPAQTELI